MNEPDRAAGDENAYDEHRERLAALELEDEDAFEITDPKHPRHHEVMSDIWDNREKVA